MQFVSFNSLLLLRCYTKSHRFYWNSKILEKSNRRVLNAIANKCIRTTATTIAVTPTLSGKNSKEKSQQLQQQNHFDNSKTTRQFSLLTNFYTASKPNTDTVLPDTSFHRYQSIMEVPDGLFRGSLDRFNGITIDSAKEFDKDVDFKEKLQKSLEHWKNTKRRAIWFKVNIEHSDWISILTKHDFDFHHANNGFVVLVRWLPLDESSNLPPYAHTMIGVGGCVINDNNQVLVVSDRFAMIPSSWKLPGGYVEQKENLINAAIREVREETGIETEFETIISIRHSHGGSFSCSDIYVVVGLRPKTLELKPCPREIAKVDWMPIDEYLKHPHVHETNRHFVRTFLDYRKRAIRFTCQIAKHEILKKEYCLYFMEPIVGNDPPTNETKSDEEKNIM